MRYLGYLFVVFIALCLFSRLYFDGLRSNDFAVRAIEGEVHAVFDRTYPLSRQGDAPLQSYSVSSQQIPLEIGMKIRGHAVLQSGPASCADILVKPGMTIRMDENTIVRMTDWVPGEQQVQFQVVKGMVLFKVKKHHELIGANGKHILSLYTDEAKMETAAGSGVFSYSPRTKEVRIHVTADNVSFQLTGRKTKIPIAAGSRMTFNNTTIYPAIDKSSAIQNTEKEKIRNMKSGLLPHDLVTRFFDFNFVNTVREKIAVVEMLTFFRGLEEKIYQTASFSDIPSVPDNLDKLNLTTTDLTDYWQKKIHYRKLSSSQAILISTGPDKILHSQDDIFVAITL